MSNTGGIPSGNEWIKGAVTEALSGTGTSLDESEAVAYADGVSPEVAEKELPTENSEVSDLMLGSEPKLDSSEKASPKAPGKQETSSDGTKEFVVVTDESGKRRKVEIDYSNKEAVKKAFTEAAGMRKFQADRDREIQSRKQLETKLQERENDWNKLEEAYAKGPGELFDLLAGSKGAFDAYISKHIEKQEFLKNATPEEIRALEAEERAQLQAKELEKIRQENEKFRKEMLGQKEQAETAALESKVHPAFDKYRFADKLGDADDEQLFDEMLWNSALKRLEPYEEQGLDLTPELIEKEFRTVAQSIRKRIGVQAEKKADRVIEQKKQEAKENIQAKVMSGYKVSDTANEAKSLLNKNDLTTLIKGWGKFGSAFQSKK